MPHTFNERLHDFCDKEDLITLVDALWEKHRPSSRPFLHELPDWQLVLLFRIVGELIELVKADRAALLAEQTTTSPTDATQLLEGARRSQQEAVEFRKEHGDISLQPNHRAISGLEGVVDRLHSSLSMVLAYLEEKERTNAST